MCSPPVGLWVLDDLFSRRLCQMLTGVAQPYLIQFEQRVAPLEFPVDRTRLGTIGLVSDMSARSASIQSFSQVGAMFK